MRWLADENLHSGIVRELRNAGHDVSYAAEDARQVSDHQLLDIAHAEGRVLLTEDKDFGEIVFREGGKSAGVVLLRMHSRNWAFKWTRLLGAIAKHGQGLQGCFTVIETADIRSHPLQSG